MPYYTATQSTIYIGETWADEIFGVRYRTNCNTTPYYGYASSKFDAVVRGKYLVEGEILVYYNKLRYFWTLMVENLNSRKKITPAEDKSGQEAAAEECAEKVEVAKDQAKSDAIAAKVENGEDPSSKARYEKRRNDLWNTAPSKSITFSNAGSNVAAVKRTVGGGPSAAVDSNTTTTPATKTSVSDCDVAALESKRNADWRTAVETLEFYLLTLSHVWTLEDFNTAGWLQGEYYVRRCLAQETERSSVMWDQFQYYLANFKASDKAWKACRYRDTDEDTGNNTGTAAANNDPTTGAPAQELDPASDGSVVVINENGTEATVTATAPSEDPQASAMSAIRSYLDKYPDGLGELSKKLLLKAVIKMSPNRSPLLAGEATFKELNEFLGTEVFRLSDVELAGPFDIMVLTGIDEKATMNSFWDDTSKATPAMICKLKDCFLTGKAQDFLQNDQLLYTAYTFFAREEL